MTAVLTVAGFVAVPGWVADLAGAFRPHYAVIGAACVAGMAVVRRWLGVLVAASVVAVNAAVLAPLWLNTPVPPLVGAPAFTVLWHNMIGASEERAPSLIEAIAAADADIVVLAQVEGAVAQALDRSEVLPHDFVYHDRDARVVVLARVPVSAVGPVGPLPTGSRHAAVALQAHVGSRRRVAILGMHTRSPRTPRRAAVRDAELAVAASWARDQDTSAVIVGDLNTPPWSRQFRDLARSAGLVNSLGGYGLQPTWPARWGLASVPIDHALHSPDLTVVARSTGPSLGSAHRSLRVTLAPIEMEPRTTSP